MNMYLVFAREQQIFHNPNLSKAVICFSSLLPVSDTEMWHKTHFRGKTENTIYGQIHRIKILRKWSKCKHRYSSFKAAKGFVFCFCFSFLAVMHTAEFSLVCVF